MNVIEKVESLDLNTAVPRSSRETMEGIAHLPLMVDKARAYQNNNLGEYIRSQRAIRRSKHAS